MVSISWLLCKVQYYWTALNLDVQVFVWTFVINSLGYIIYLGVELLGHMVTLCLIA